MACNSLNWSQPATPAAERNAHVHLPATCMPPTPTAACPPKASNRRWRRCAAHAAANNSDTSISFARSAKQLTQEQQGNNPWAFGFQLNERYIQWEDSAAVQMTKLYIAQKTGKDVAWVNSQLSLLAVLLPDIVAKLGRMKADLVLALASDTQGIAQRLIQLEALLPGVDLSRLAARYPALLLEHTPPGIAAKLEALRAALPDGTAVERLVEREPVLLDVEITQTLAEIKRVMPGADPATVLLRHPSSVLDMAAHRMGSSLQDTQ